MGPWEGSQCHKAGMHAVVWGSKFELSEFEREPECPRDGQGDGLNRGCKQVAINNWQMA